MFTIQALSSIIKRLSKREKVVLYTAIFIISLTFLDGLIINPILSKLVTLNAQIQEKEEGIRRNLRILARRDKIISESSKYKAFMDNYKTEEEEATSILKEVERLAKKNSIDLAEMAPRREIRQGAESKEYSITLTCEAEMKQILNFLYDIENSRKLLTVRRYEIGPKGRDSNVAQCSMTVSKLVMLNKL